MKNSEKFVRERIVSTAYDFCTTCKSHLCTMARLSTTHARDFRVDASLFVMLGIHLLTMTISVQLQYHEPMFTLLIGTVYGPVLALTILIVSSVEYLTIACFKDVMCC